ncbi:MAG TPA: lipid II flippase MurJ, partial [Verrucomicrobiota bacterium]|nr:lipid II flippase MurJ [Verrucomicrobiota bacterium]
LAGFAAEKRWAGFRDTLHQGVQLLLFVNLLAAMLLFVLARPIVRLFFEGGLFRASGTLAVAPALMLLAPGLVAFSLTNVLARAFYATGDLRTPMWISVFCLGANTLLAIPLVFTFAAAGLAAANTVTATLNVLLLGYALRRKFRTLALGTLRRPGGLLLLALVPATAAAAGASFAWELLLGGTGFWARLGAVFVPMLLAAGTYFPFALWLRLEPATEVLNLLRRRRSGSA